MDVQSEREFETMSVILALIAIAGLVALWNIHREDMMKQEMETCSQGSQRVELAEYGENAYISKTLYVYCEGEIRGLRNFRRGGDDGKSFVESYDVLPLTTYVSDLAYAASPYAKTALIKIGRTSPSVEALRVQAPLNAPRRSTLTASMSAGSKDII